MSHHVHVFSGRVFLPLLVAAFRRWFSPGVISRNEFWALGSGARLADDDAATATPVQHAVPMSPVLCWKILTVPVGTKLVIHGLFGRWLVLALYLSLWLRPGLVRRSQWMIWGGDIEPDTDISWRGRIFHAMKKVVIRRFGCVLSVLPDDHRTAVEQFGATTRRLPVFYPGIVDESLLRQAAVSTHVVSSLRRIVVGNSATPSNRHLALLELLDGGNTGDVHFILPLSYGDPAYRELVGAAWRRRFGAHCEILDTLMPLAGYAHLMATVDAGIYHYERQQGLGNILLLLAMGKPVYMPASGKVARFLQRQGIRVRDIHEFLSDVGGELTAERRLENEENARIVLREFSDDAARGMWARVIGA